MTAIPCLPPVSFGWSRQWSPWWATLALLVGCNGFGLAGEAVTPSEVPEPWIPSKLDDWVALEVEAKAYADSTSKPGWSCAIGHTCRSPDEVGAGMPRPPSDAPADALLSLTYTVRQPDSAVFYSCGQTELWRGADGKPAAATLYFIRSLDLTTPFPIHLATSWPADEKELARALAAHPAPAPGWKIVACNAHAVAVAWQRPNATAAMLPPPEPLRPADRSWLSARPASLPVTPLVAPSTPYADRRTACEPAKQGLAWFKAGYPVEPIVVCGIDPGGLAEQAGLKLGDCLLSVDGHPITSPGQFGQLIDAAKTPKVTVRICRLGAKPLDILIGHERLGVRFIESVADPGRELLAMMEPLGENAMTDAAVVLYGVADRQLATEALKRLPPRMPRPLRSAFQAWILATYGDFGAADLALEEGLKDTKSPARAWLSNFRDGVRWRSGHYLWTNGTTWQNPENERLLLRIVAGIPAAERFNLLDGRFDHTVFTTDARDQVEDRCGNAGPLLQQGTLSLDGGIFPIPNVRLANLPEQVVVSFDCVLEAGGLAPTEMFLPATSQFFGLGFAAVDAKQLIRSGYGGVDVWFDGACRIFPADPTTSRLAYRPRPVAGRTSIDVDGKTKHHVQATRWGNMQRVEIDGNCVYQGFIRPLAVGFTLGFGMEIWGMRCTISDFHITTPKPPVKKSDF